jgi:hypothetical protein
MHVRGVAKAEAQFFKIFGGTPSGPGPLEESNSRKTFITSSMENYIVPNEGSVDTSFGLGFDGIHGSSVYVSWKK